MAWLWFVLFVLSFAMVLAAWQKVRELEDRLGLPADERVTVSKRAVEAQDRAASPPLPSSPPSLRAPGPPATPVKAPARPRANHARRWSEGETGPAATFTYVDADGVVTDRDVRNWRSDGPHIKAHCLLAGASRTFRKDRIEDWAVQA